MYYLSDIINDLAFVFPYIEDMEKKYDEFGLLIDTKLIVFPEGYKVAITPYEPTYSRAKQD